MQHLNPKNIIFKNIFLLLTSCFLLLASDVIAYADTMSNDSFNLDTENMSIDGANQLNSNDNPVRTIQSPFAKNYQIENASANTSLSFTTNQTVIDFETISSTDPVLRNLNLSLSNTIGSAQVLAYEDHPLISTTAATIANTSCDNGSCSETTAAQWNDSLTYGFGYHCDNLKGTSCADDFNQEDYFRPFSDLTKKQSSQNIMQSNNPVDNIQAQIIYKVNISATQPNLYYTNTVTYLAVPGF